MSRVMTQAGLFELATHRLKPAIPHKAVTKPRFHRRKPGEIDSGRDLIGFLTSCDWPEF
jgi:hypothetical protein